MTEHEHAHADDLLRKREARGLQFPIGVRIAVCTYLLVTLATIEGPTLLRLLGAGTIATVVGLNAYFLFVVRRQRALHAVGIAGATIDALFLALPPIMWARVLDAMGFAPGYITNAPLTAFTIGFVVINGLALNPLYPTIVTAGGFLVHAGFWAHLALNPRTHISNEPLATMTSDAVAPALEANRLVILVVSCVSVVVITRAARRMVRDGIRLEADKQRIEREQVRLVMTEKMQALGKLVAGVSHELNSPLGAVQSASDTSERALAKLRRAIEAGDASGATKALDVLGKTGDVTLRATRRIENTVGALRRFARLDEAEFQRVDLRECLDSAWQRVAPALRERARLEREYEEIPNLHGYPAELSQAFLTLLENACEALPEEGGTVTLEVAVRDGAVVASVSDTGRGMDPDSVRSMFDVSLSPKAGHVSRVRAGLGLPAVHSVALHHAAELDVESEPGKGTRFELRFPMPK